MRFPSAGANGRSRARAPVATMMFLAVRSSDFPSLVTISLFGQPAVAHMDGNLVFLHQMRDALIKLLGHAARAFDDGIDISSDIVGGEAVILGMLHVMIDFGRTQQRLGGDAPPVKANPAESLALDNRNLQAKLRRADGGNVTAGSGTEDDEVVVRH
jgi:hypothetical protein